MKKQVEKEVVYAIFSALFILLLVSVVSAGFTDFIKSITGKAITGDTNASITITGTAAVTINIDNSTLTGAAVDPTEAGTQQIVVVVTVSDADGVDDINDSSVLISLIKAGQTTRVNLTACATNAGESTTTSQNYTCAVDLNYYDSPGGWTINVNATDLGNKTVITNNSMSFSYDTLTSMVIYPDHIYWPASAQGATNVEASNTTTINNTGNYNVSAGNVEVEGIHLYGATGDFIDVGNFTSDILSPACSGQALSNGSSVGITEANLTRGDLLLGGGSGQEVLYYCLNLVPTLPSQSYSTSQSPGESWTVKIV